MMLKPQFEAKPDQLRSGVVKNDAVRRCIIKDFEQWLKQNGYYIVSKRDNSLYGKTGNKERFYYLKLAKK
jgi:predicted rRNA methylase YqxC with S4 and FtsJ domains